MRHIHVEPGLRLRFACRDEAFNEGVEVGLLAANMAAGLGAFTMTISVGTLDQARALAASLRYRVHVVAADAAWAEVMFLTGSRRPKLHVVQGDPAARAGTAR